jgi:hypothetical protein
MRKIISSIMLVAVAAMASVSCQKQEIAAPETISTTLTLNAEVEQTKTYLYGNTVLWGKGEAVSLYVGSGETAKFFDSASTDAYDGEASASFTFEIKDVTEADSYALGGIYPASASKGITNDNPKSYKVALPSTQNADPGTYDPSAYIMVLKPETVDQLETEYKASFRRAVALNNITLTNVKEDISTIEITVPNTKYLAGRRSFDLTTGESGDVYENGGRTNTIKVNSAYKVNSADPERAINVWFTSWGVELEAGQELTVKMISSSKIYTRTITAKEGGIKFVEGDLNKLTVNMASATEEVNTDLSGEYLIASVPESWNLMSGTNDGKYYSHIVSGVTTSATEVKCSDFYSLAGVGNYVWTVEKMGDNYSIKNKTTGKYVSYRGNENEAYTSDDAEEFVLSEKDGVMTVESKAVATRKLKYNSTSPRFAFYTSDQTPLYFIPWEADTTPRIFVDEKNYEVEAAEGSIDIEYTTNDVVTGQINASVKSGASMTINSTSVADGKVTVNYAANTAQDPKTATIILSYDGAESKEVVITQLPAGATKQYYVKVTAEPTDWSGKYLIVFDDNKAHATVSGKDFNVTSNSLIIDDGKIEATSDLSNATVTISKYDNGYSILLPSGAYLKVSSASPISSSSAVANYLSFVNNTTQNGSIRISGDSNFNTSSYILYHQSNYFRCYTNKLTNTGYKLPDLYKLEEGGETTEPEEPETPAEPTELNAPEVTCSESDITEKSLKFTWNAVANASKYEVTFNNGKPTETQNTEYTATGLKANTKYTISVKAVGDGVNYTTSEAGTAEGTTKEEQQSGGGDQPTVAPSGTVLWSENWGTYTGTVANYTYTGTTVYGGSTANLVYSVDNANDKIESTTANPISSNNLFFYKSAASSWTVQGIDLAGATSVTLKYTVNRTNVAVYYSVDGAAEEQLNSSSTSGVNNKMITNLSGSTLKLRFNKTGTSQNCRIDDISVIVN